MGDDRKHVPASTLPARERGDSQGLTYPPEPARGCLQVHTDNIGMDYTYLSTLKTMHKIMATTSLKRALLAPLMIFQESPYKQNDDGNTQAFPGKWKESARNFVEILVTFGKLALSTNRGIVAIIFTFFDEFPLLNAAQTS